MNQQDIKVQSEIAQVMAQVALGMLVPGVSGMQPCAQWRRHNCCNNNCNCNRER